MEIADGFPQVCDVTWCEGQQGTRLEWMARSSEESAVTELFRATLQDDGVHSSRFLSRDVARGTKLRVRHGVYVDYGAWTQAPPWKRHRIAIAATALRDPSLVFCRETALLLHGLPLRQTPVKVMARTSDSGWAGTKRPPRMAGRNAGTPGRGRQQRTGEFPAALRNIPIQHIEHALPPGVGRHELRDVVRSSTFVPPHVLLPPRALAEVRGPSGYQAEPVELALVDTVSRMPFADAVIVLDAALGRSRLQLAEWLPYLTSARRRLRWHRAWEFADIRSESPGESLSRALIHELGFPAPALQQIVRTDEGEFRLDFCWQKQGIIGEFDGRVKYFDDALLAGEDSREVLYREKLREDALRRAGWRVARWGWSQLQRPEGLVRRLQRAGLEAR